MAGRLGKLRDWWGGKKAVKIYTVATLSYTVATFYRQI
jgi:hypothetical protein